ncbi:MAG TPA: hypothetical protein DIU20_13585 [Cryomorphaceae bacterium]|nr:hypothetical protein [Cryomorphaceae bacterium]
MYKSLLTAAFLITGIALHAQQSFDDKVTSASNVRLNVSNYATFGNAWRGYKDGSGDPSCEYPAGSGIEHLFEGGIWIGGVTGGGQQVVSTSAYDAPQGYAPGRSGFEITADVGSTLMERSSLFDSKYYDPRAVSHQDYVAICSDKNVKVPGTDINIQDHNNPMNVEIEMQTYNWNFNFSDFMVIVNLKIRNTGVQTFSNFHVALWNNTVVRNVNITPAGSGGAAFDSKGGNGFMDSLNMAYCYDAAGDVGFTESYIGQMFLGAEDKNGFHHPRLDSTYNVNTQQWEPDDFKLHYNAWTFQGTSEPIFFFPQSDQARFKKMTEGLNYNPCWDNPTGGPCQSGFGIDLQAQLNQPGNRSDLISAGPFADFGPGDEVNVAFAYVLAKKKEDGNPNTANNEEQRANLIENAGWAQQAYNGEDKNFNGILDPGEDNDDDDEITRFILPSPPAIPRTKIVALENRIEIYWSDNSRYSVDPISNEQDFEGYRVYLSKLGFDVTGVPDLARDFNLVAEYDVPGNNIFKETGFGPIELAQPKTFEDDTVTYYYRYVIDNIPNGWQYAVAVTSFDRGDSEAGLESLESSFLANNFRAFPGTQANDDIETEAPFAYPNPYYYGAAWEGRSNFQEESRKMIFANLPKRCRIRIFTVAGDFIDEIYHDENYSGSDIRWYKTFGAENVEENRFSGGEHAWDLLSLDSQIISRGLYMFSVEDLDTGKETVGKFVIIK